MPGAHSRPSEREDTADDAAVARPRRSRTPAPEVDTARPDTGEIDRNYGDLPRSRADIGPAPLSPPVGFPAMSSSSFREDGPSADARGARTPDAPARTAEGGASARSAPRPPMGPSASAVVPPPPPPRTSGASEQPGARTAGSRPPSAPGRGGPPARPGVPPAGPAAPGRGPRGATVAPPPGAPQAPGRRPGPATGTTTAAPPNTQQGPGAAAAPPVVPPRVPAPSPAPPTSGPSPAPPLGAAPARPAPPAGPVAPAPRGPVPPRPAGPAGPVRPGGDTGTGAAPQGPRTTVSPESRPADRSTRRDASAGPATKVEKPVTDAGDDAAGPDSPRRMVATRTTNRSTTRDSTTRSGTTSTTRAAATRTTSRAATTSSTSRSHAASGRAASRTPRGAVATAVAGVLAVVAARIATLPGGERVVAAGHWVQATTWRYLDGPRPEKLTATALRWQRARRSAYAALAAMIGMPVLMLGFGWLFISVPNADEAVESQLNTVSFADGTILARISPGEQGNRQKVDISRVPVPVQHAVLSAEDRSYYENSGFDVQGIARAVWKNLTGGTGGGSTITQQYVKNAMVGDEYSLMRKYKELIISSKIAQERSKDQILGDYLNSIYFGRGAYGIQAASQAYFGRPVETLTPAEGALLAGIIQSPSRWDPAIKYDDAVRRWNYVMDGMVTQNWISPADRAGARFPTTIPPRKAANGVPDDDRGHIYSAVKDELARLGINEDALVTEGLQIQTSIQPEAQREAVEAARKELLGQPGNLRSSIVSVNPKDGSVVAYYGGDNGSGLNYAEVSKQPGSTFKPFVLLAALQKDPPIGLSTEFDGRAVPGKTVRNSEGADCDNCNLKRAMTLSNNVVYTALGNKVGPQAIAAAAHQAGVTQKLENPTSGIALGNSETTPFDMASAYATLANDGLYYKPHLVQKVTTASGDVLYDQNTGKGEQRIDPEVARNVVEAMTDVPKQDDAALSGGRVSAAKSGTVQSHIEEQNNDAWFVGFTPGLSTAIWVGTDDNTPIRTAGGKPVFGHGLPSDMWKRYMDQALSGQPEKSFSEFTPIAGGDPGDTTDGGAQESASASSSPTSSSSSSPTSTTSASSRGQQQQPTVPTSTVPAAPAAPQVPAAEAPPAAARVPVRANGTGAGAVEPDAGTVPEDTGG